VSQTLLRQLAETTDAAERERLVLRFSLDSLDPDLLQHLRVAAIPHRFDQPFVASLLQVGVADAQDVCAKLSGLPHVRRRRDGVFEVQEATRNLLLDDLWKSDRSRFLELSRRAAAHCARQDRSDLHWLAEYVYHSCLGPVDDVMGLLRRAIADWQGGPNLLSWYAAAIPPVLQEHVEAGRLTGHVPDKAEIWQNMIGHQSNQYRVALALEGGGALCAYQAGVYQALHEAGIEPDYIVSESMGTVNAAIIAGNPPESRVERLGEFWSMVGSSAFDFGLGWSPLLSTLFGIQGLVSPRVISPIFMPLGGPEATSFYDPTPLRETLYRMVDFDLLNRGRVRFAAGAVNVGTGNYVYFDTAHMMVTPEHVLASTAFPPTMPMVELDGESYWDGGLSSVTALSHLLNDVRDTNMLIFQIHLFAAASRLPRNLKEVQTQAHNIRYSSRARLVTDYYLKTQGLRQTLKEVLQKLPEERRGEREQALLEDLAADPRVDILNLIYRQDAGTEITTSDFSGKAIKAHWLAGYEDTVVALREHEVPADARGGGITVSQIRRQRSRTDDQG
jgi:NTE family protein